MGAPTRYFNNRMQHPTIPMNEADPSSLHAEAAHRHLSTNASECVRLNIIVRVETVNADRTVAFCSVRQGKRGVLRRTYTQSELVWRAQQALAPLNGLGILPMINVHMPSDPTARHERSSFTWLQRLLSWLGMPWNREGFDVPALPGDPFGLLSAMRVPMLK